MMPYRMRNALVGIVAGLLLSMAPPACAAQVTVLTATRIDTMDVAQPRVEAMAFDADGRILALGDSKPLLARYRGARRIDAGKAVVIPGMIDAHGHMAGLGMARLTVDLVGTADKAEVLQRLRDFAKNLPPDAWLTGRGWDQNDWPQHDGDKPDFPTAADLDTEFPERPVWLERVDGHAGWANSAAMHAVGRDLSGDWQPDGGRIVRDAQGRATGVFVDIAADLVNDAMPAPDTATIERALKLAMDDAVAHGLTGVHDAGIPLAEFRIYQRLADQGEMPLRITAMADGDKQALAWLCENGIYQHASHRLKMRTVKLYIDGALGSRGAALLQDYSDDHGNRGLLLMQPAQLDAVVSKAKQCGVQVATHAIGDRGNRIVLDAYARALSGASAGSDQRWRIEHAQVLAPEDLPRLARLQVIASMQPTHATSDMPWAQDRVGAQRIVGAYAWRQLRDSGARLALGSDFPVESVDPRLGLHAATTRTDDDGKPAGGWHPEELLTTYEALRGFTLDAGYAGFAEAEVGSLAVGKRADFVLLAEDPLSMDPARLRSLQVLATYVDGRPVFEAGKAASGGQ